MVFDGDNPAAALFGVFDDEFGVDRLNGERIHDSNLDAFRLQLVGSLDKLQ